MSCAQNLSFFQKVVDMRPHITIISSVRKIKKGVHKWPSRPTRAKRSTSSSSRISNSSASPLPSWDRFSCVSTSPSPHRPSGWLLTLSPSVGTSTSKGRGRTKSRTPLWPVSRPPWLSAWLWCTKEKPATQAGFFLPLIILKKE